MELVPTGNKRRKNKRFIGREVFSQQFLSSLGPGSDPTEDQYSQLEPSPAIHSPYISLPVLSSLDNPLIYISVLPLSMSRTVEFIFTRILCLLTF